METINIFDITNFLNNFTISNQDECTNKIIFGKNFEFNYLNPNDLVYNNDNFSFKDIFKFNMFLIVSQLKNLFNEDIDITINFDSPCKNEILMFDLDKCNIHNVYVQMFKPNGKYANCAFDFVEKTFNINKAKYVNSIVNLDLYRYYEEDTNNYNKFIENVIFRLLILLCNISKDEYALAEILFAKTKSESKSQSQSQTQSQSNIKKELEIFRKIIYSKKSNKFDLYMWWEEIIPTDLETGEDLDFDNFVKIIENDIGKIKFESNKEQSHMIPYTLFQKIMLNIDSKLSKKINDYKNIYIQSIDVLMEALRTINELVDEINKTKNYIPEYVNNLLSKDIIYYNDKDILDKIYMDLTILYETE